MALRGGYTTKSAVYLERAYINIPVIMLTKQSVFGVKSFVGSIRAFVYKDEVAYMNGIIPVDEFDLSFTLDENATIAWAYLLLKNENIIENTEDC